MINIPNLPPKEDLEYREKSFIISLYEQWRMTSRKWLYALAVVVVLGLPLGLVMKSQLAKKFIASYHAPAVHSLAQDAKPLEVLESETILLGQGLYAAYAKVLNPNTNLAARKFDYQFVFKDATNQTIKIISGSNFALNSVSSIVSLPTVELSQEPKSVEFLIGKVSWTAQVPTEDLKFEVLQQRSGDTPENKFFIEGLVKNDLGVIVKQIEVTAAVYDTQNKKIIGLNSTVLTDVLADELRYFRLLWPRSQSELFGTSIGRMELTAIYNPFSQPFRLSPTETIPSR